MIDIRSIVPLDMETIKRSVQKTNRVLVVTENQATGGFSGEIAARITQECFEYLDAPVTRVCSADCPIPFSRILEAAVLVDEAKIAHAIENIMAY